MKPKLLGRAWHDCGTKPKDFATSVHAGLSGLTHCGPIAKGMGFGDLCYGDDGVCEAVFIFISKEWV